ncbi:MAG: hypothetical protein U0X91_22815 [Spirosomataceae bacterium]
MKNTEGVSKAILNQRKRRKTSWNNVFAPTAAQTHAQTLNRQQYAANTTVLGNKKDPKQSIRINFEY